MAVAVARNGPRMPLGAAGFRSHMSCWGGPPQRKRKMHDLARPAARRGLAADRPVRSCGSVSAPNPASPRRSSASRRCIMDHVSRREPGEFLTDYHIEGWRQEIGKTVRFVRTAPLIEYHKIVGPTSTLR